MSHYKWLDKNLPEFFAKLNLPYNASIIDAHGDKCYGNTNLRRTVSISIMEQQFFLLTYLEPFSNEVREIENGWVDTFDWIVKNKERFLPNLPPVESA